MIIGDFFIETISIIIVKEENFLRNFKESDFLLIILLLI